MRSPDCFALLTDGASIPVTPILAKDLPPWLQAQPAALANFVRSAGFTADSGKVLALPGEAGVAGFIAGRDSKSDGMWAGALASSLPDGPHYRLEGIASEELDRCALSWGLGAYQFNAYKTAKRAAAKLALPPGLPSREVMASLEAAYLVRDLVNVPAGDMGPDEIEQAARALAELHQARIAVTAGEDLLRDGFNLIHAVGRASSRAPRLIDISWGDAHARKLTLVGKGIVFDTGGLDIKPSSNMILMKKDMGGAAHALALGHLVMSAKLPVRLRILLPIAENAISGNAFRPSDIVKSYKGLTVEIGNTDAEGRLVLADALALGDADEPNLIIDFATLTGAARTALGPELPALFTDDDALAGELIAAGDIECDPMWRLPLWQPYAKWLESPVADINNTGSSAFAGAITAALFLKRFVEKAKSWAHLDIYAWSVGTTPTRSVGGEPQALRSVFRVLKKRYG